MRKSWFSLLCSQHIRRAWSSQWLLVISRHDVLADGCDDVSQVPGVQESILVTDTHA